MSYLLEYIRPIILAVSTVIAILVSNIQPIHQTYSFLALIYLYFSLLPSPLYSVFPTFPFRGLFIKARRSIGISAFAFAGLHGYYSLVNVIGGLPGLQLLEWTYAMEMSLGIFGIFFLTLLASTSLIKRLFFLDYPLEESPSFSLPCRNTYHFHAYLIGPILQTVSLRIQSFFPRHWLFYFRLRQYVSKNIFQIRK